mmetsp:Transcript_32469/g.69142  ORF Transcript_32469/g.69142 Transcript_32469/m.69142 type:complete len:105 (+) Transcript_32469:42-356(+)
MAFPEASKDLILQLIANVGEHISAPEHADDKAVILELSKENSADRAPAFEEVIRRRVAEKPESQLAPYNSPEGAVFLRNSLSDMCKSDADVQATWQKWSSAYKP